MLALFSNSLLALKEIGTGLTLSGPVSKLLLLVLAIPIASTLINQLLAYSILGRYYRLFVAPGVILHEVCHAIGCLLTGARIRAFSIFDKTGGSVEHYRAKIPVFGPIIISLAPFAGGGIVIFLLSKMVGFIEIDPAGISAGIGSLKDAIVYLVSSVDYRKLENWGLMYLLISVAVTMNPSFQDMKNIFLSLLTLVLVAAGIWRFTAYRPDFGHLISFLPHQFFVVISTIDLLLLLGLILSIIIFVVSKLIKPV